MDWAGRDPREALATRDLGETNERSVGGEGARQEGASKEWASQTAKDGPSRASITPPQDDGEQVRATGHRELGGPSLMQHICDSGEDAYQFLRACRDWLGEARGGFNGLG